MTIERKTITDKLVRLEAKGKPLPKCIFCGNDVKGSQIVDYAISKTGEKYWHADCYEKEYGKAAKAME